MAIREVRARGLEHLSLVTSLLQRARLADAHVGLWEAADLQWWWRTPRRSDGIGQLFWIDGEGPIAAGVLTDWERAWSFDPIRVRGGRSVPLAEVWARAVEAIRAQRIDAVDVMVRDDDAELTSLLTAAGFAAGDDQSSFSWMDAGDRPEVAGLPEGFVLVDRDGETRRPHPMRKRNGEAVAQRLSECSLYDPGLDLAVEAPDGRVAGYALFWFDPITEVGLVEPMRVEDEFQRRGLGRALLTEGLNRLAMRGASRLKVGFASGAGRGLYLGAGFRVTASARTYRGVIE